MMQMIAIYGSVDSRMRVLPSYVFLVLLGLMGCSEASWNETFLVQEKLEPSVSATTGQATCTSEDILSADSLSGESIETPDERIQVLMHAYDENENVICFDTTDGFLDRESEEEAVGRVTELENAVVWGNASTSPLRLIPIGDDNTLRFRGGISGDPDPRPAKSHKSNGYEESDPDPRPARAGSGTGNPLSTQEDNNE